MKKSIMYLVTFLLILGTTVSAQALIIFNDWTLDLTSLGYSKTENIDQILFNGIAWSKTDDTNGDYMPNPGEIGSTDGLLSSLTYLDSDGIQSNWSGFELTFDFSFNSIGINSPLADYLHLAAGTTINNSAFYRDGILDLYVDDRVSNGADTTFFATQTTGVGYTDGSHIASFKILPGIGGSFSAGSLDGNDDAAFELISVTQGILFDKNGNDLFYSLGQNTYTIGLTDTNFDGDKDNNGKFDSTFGSAIWNPGTQSPVNFLAQQDGSASLGAVPEPTTMVLLGMGLICISGLGRKKYIKS